jgi:diaminohydroxyphosphoribosylaminopyrimidine deaminase/5-amino-6-(5-phosphoribosylamino)uracil reductase
MTPSHAADVAWLERAVDLAWNGVATTSPNPRVGCVIVRGGKVIGEGWHQWAGQGHAEVNAIAAAGGNVRGTTVYVSLEPCAFVGRTPACAQRLIDEGVARVVVAQVDPHPRVSGQGLAMLAAAGIETEVIALESVRRLNPGYEKRIRSGQPFVRIKIAASMDGRTAMANGDSQWITGDAARADVQALRARSCAVITGIGTVLADDPALTVRDERFRVAGKIRQPLIVVVDSKLRTPPGAKVLQSPGEVLIVHGESRPAWLDEHRSLSIPGAKIDPGALLSELAGHQVNEVLVEAGPTLAGAFLGANLWDELVLYLAPKFLGDDARPLAALRFPSLHAALGAKIAAHERVGEDLKLTLHPHGR